MPIGYIRQTHGTRSNGQSAVASSAYRSGEILEDKRYGKTHDYSRKENILYTDFMYPEGSPEWVTKGRGSFWNAVEAFEDRKDARLYRDFMGALQNDMTAEENIKIVKLFAEHLRAQGMVVDVAVHGESAFSKENIHFHLSGSERNIDADGFGLKAKDSLSRSWNSKAWYNEQRLKYLEITNTLRMEKGLPFVEYNDQKGESVHYLPSVWKEMQKAKKTLGLVYEDITAYSDQMEKLDMEIQQEIKTTKEIGKKDAQGLSPTNANVPSGIVSLPEKTIISKQDYINMYTNASPEQWKKSADHNERALTILKEQVILTYAKKYSEKVIKQIDEIELPKLKKEYKEFVANEPVIDKRGLFNKEAVESQTAYYKEWEAESKKLQRAGLAKIQERDKIEDLKSDSDFMKWQKERQGTDKLWYGTAFKIEQTPEQFTNQELRNQLEAYKEVKQTRVNIQRKINQEKNKDQGYER